jgi:chromosomal replication initiator protein
MVEIDIIWQQCLILLKDQFGEQDYNTWFRLLKAKYENDKLQIVASNRLVQDFIKNKYWDRISNILAELTGGIQSELVVGANTQQKFVPVSTTENTADTLSPSNSASVITMPSKSKAKIDKEVLATLQQATKLNPNYIFESLVRGNSNQLAYAIGMHVTQKPGNKNHNPLFIYGGVGLGKTHLMQAIGNEIHNKNPKAKIRYLHANDYIQDVVKASMRQGFDELKKYYNSLDLLLMDDIQFIAGDKTKTQEEFFYTFNTLLDKGKQVIMTCDTYPKNINNLNERLISRFASGLTVEIQPPELEMRVAILKRKAEQNRLNLEDDVAFFIAQNIKSNVRELEGALNKVLYQAQFSGKGISLAIAKEALMDILAMDSRSISIDDIQKTVCDFYKLRISDLLSNKRTQIIARPRQIAMTLAKELTQHSLPAIGNAFGGRDHTTVMHAQKTINSLRKSDDKIEREYSLLIQMLNN